MTTDLFIEWLDKQIAIAVTWDNAVKPHEISSESEIFRTRAKVFEQVKEKYLSLKTTIE